MAIKWAFNAEQAIANSNDVKVSLDLRRAPIIPSYTPRFRRYPPFSELLIVYRETHQRMVTLAICALTEEGKHV